MKSDVMKRNERKRSKSVPYDSTVNMLESTFNDESGVANDVSRGFQKNTKNSRPSVIE